MTEEFDLSTLPVWEARSFCRKIAKMTEKFFEDPENQKRFKEWQKQRKEKEKVNERKEGIK